MKKLKYISILFALTLSISLFSQENKKPLTVDGVLTKITPSENLDFWILVKNNDGINEEIYTSGTKKEYTTQTSGFKLIPVEKTFYYIVYSKKGNIEYITEIAALKGFFGKINNAQEAALSAFLEGYFIDEHFTDVAANYYEDVKNYYLDLGKITSKECPYQKKYFTLTVNKATGEISNVKENGTYIEVYTKKCTNNPRLLKIENKVEQQEEPKKQSSKAKK